MTEAEFTAIVASTKRVVLAAVRRHLYARYSHAIDDVAQETYLRAYRNLVKKGFRDESSMETWLYAIARNESIRMNERLIRQERTARKSMEAMLARTEPSEPVESFAVDLSAGIAALPERYRMVMELVAAGLSEKEIAMRMGIPRGTVKSRASRGRELLGRMQGGRYGEE